MKMIAGLGNPGEKYASTRHNLGFLLLDYYVAGLLPVEESEHFWVRDNKFKSAIGKIPDKGLVFIKPQTYMNNSGLAVAEVVRFYKFPLEDLIVIHDELDLPLGKIKIRQGGSAAGHHGVESIINRLRSDNFIRLRLGIGNLRTQSGEQKGEQFDANKYVVQEFLSEEKAKVRHMLKLACQALEVLVSEGIETAQNRFH